MHTWGLVRRLGISAVTAMVAAAPIVSGACTARKIAVPVATIGATVNRSTAAPGSPISISYRIVPLEGATVPDGYWLFVHLVDQQGSVLWTDDHAPSVPSGQWRASAPIEYTRTTFVPRAPYNGPVSVDVGLFDPGTGTRLSLTGTDMGMATYRLATFSVEPSTDDVFIVFGDGWHDGETAGETVGTSWRWSRGLAALSFRNPGRDAALLLDLDRPVEGLTEASHVELRIGQQAVGAFDVSGPRTIHEVFLPRVIMGTAPTVELRLSVRPTFVPSALPQLRSSDSRELGVRVFNTHVAIR